jgi:hypothetical protein
MLVSYRVYATGKVKQERTGEKCDEPTTGHASTALECATMDPYSMDPDGTTTMEVVVYAGDPFASTLAAIEPAPPEPFSAPRLGECPRPQIPPSQFPSCVRAACARTLVRHGSLTVGEARWWGGVDAGNAGDLMGTDMAAGKKLFKPHQPKQRVRQKKAAESAKTPRKPGMLAVRPRVNTVHRSPGVGCSDAPTKLSRNAC